ncbi:phosphodiesterase [Paramagnetospirillum marisnigri]|uniref:Phosphodiesterase n=1 Tax=Paramagnetospirillum marisnigri TaxID=1285242 RepID=A0A178M5Q3_9PROT|nr:HD domain-containing phosphohydrolase [Paramagnetospirillum marisnigri]OAN44081.1 phosphodiesterase [Paramagnetospirillum marisnigri]
MGTPSRPPSAVHQGLAERLICIHDEIKGGDDLTALSRIAIALYDERTDILKTFIHSSDGDSPFDHSAARLSTLPTLQELARTGGRRVINDLEAVAATGQEHANRLSSLGYGSSYTMPIRSKNQFFGFLFLNSFSKDFFTPKVVHRLRPYAEMIALLVMRELDMVRMMQAAVRVIRQVSAVRDEETGAHLARMARYTRMIAVKLADRHGFNDEFIEYLFQFAPLHDVGKISVPDHILFKPGRLDEGEFEIMKGHVKRGLEIVDLMAHDFGMQSLSYFSVLRNVIAYHHEALDGSGYPHGLKGAEIPMEARIAAVADVFDALTSERPYKKAWSNDQALDLLVDQSGTKFDPDCVAALVDCRAEIADIQSRFEATVFD